MFATILESYASSSGYVHSVLRPRRPRQTAPVCSGAAVSVE